MFLIFGMLQSQVINLPSVSFLKAPAFQDGHAGYSNPLDEQNFIVKTINRIQKLPDWNSTAVIITYDDSDGWYDHVMPPIVSQSNDPKNDALLGKDGLCGHAPSRCLSGPLWVWTSPSFLGNISICKSKLC